MSQEHSQLPSLLERRRASGILPRLNALAHLGDESLPPPQTDDEFKQRSEAANYHGGHKLGHNPAEIVTTPHGTKYYRKTVSNSDETNTINFQKEELLLQKVQAVLMPAALSRDALKYRAVGDDQFEIEMRDGSCNLRDFLAKVTKREIPAPAEDGFVHGLATALIIKLLLGDRDNTDTNMAISLNRQTTRRGYYCATGIDAEQIGENATTRDILLNPTIAIIVAKIAANDSNKALISKMVDPKEFEYCFKLISLYRTDLQRLVETHITTEGKLGLISDNIAKAAEYGHSLLERQSSEPRQQHQPSHREPVQMGIMDRTNVPKGIMGRTEDGNAATTWLDRAQQHTQQHRRK